MTPLHIASDSESTLLIIAPSPLEGEGIASISTNSNWVRGSLRSKRSFAKRPPHPFELVDTPAQPSPSRGEGAITTTVTSDAVGYSTVRIGSGK